MLALALVAELPHSLAAITTSFAADAVTADSYSAHVCSNRNFGEHRSSCNCY